MPVTVAPINWHIEIVLGKIFLDRGNQITILLIDRANATKVFVMLGDFQHPFVRNVFSSQDVFKKRHHVILAFRAAEGND